MLPPGQDPYISAPKRDAEPNLGQIATEFLGISQPNQGSADVAEGRMEVGYMDADTQTDWRVETSEKANELAEFKRKEEEEARRRREEEEEREREEKAKRFADAMMAAMATRRQQELDAARRLQEQNLLAQEQRQKYVVLKGDTLESISQKKLRDRRLAPLVYEINKRLIPHKVDDGKKLLQLRPRLVILLPTSLEIKRYKARLFGRTNTKFEYDMTVADEPVTTSRLTNPGLVRAESTLVPWSAGSRTGVPTSEATKILGVADTAPAVDPSTQKRRNNIESLLGNLGSHVEKDGRIRYVCRLGDTLRSVAMRHPALKDLTLWRLVAEVNHLSTKTDDKGNPEAQLKRGESILLPTAAEIAKFREQFKSEAPVSGRTGGPSTNGVRSGSPTTNQLDIVCKPCPQCSRLTSMNATICPACAFPFEGRSDKPSAKLPQAPEPFEDATTSLLLAAGRVPLNQQQSEAKAEDRGTRNVITDLSHTCRIVSFGNMDESGVGFRTRLEVRQGDETWLPVVRYEINDDASQRHAFNLGGSRKTTRIDLPARAAKEMAEHDLTTNGEKYAEAFLAGRDISDVI
jgi:hypothetical protein